MKKLIIIALMVFIGCCQVPISKARAASSPQMVPFQMMPNSTGHATTLVPPASRFITNHSLTASTAKTITVPAGANWVNFSAAANLWVNFSGGVVLYPALTTISVISDLLRSLPQHVGFLRRKYV